MHSNYLIDEYDDQFDNESDSHFDDCDEDLYRKMYITFVYNETATTFPNKRRGRKKVA